MKRKIVVLLLIIVLVLSQAQLVLAKGFSGRSRSSSGFSSSSSSKSFSGSNASSTGSRGVPGSYSATGSAFNSSSNKSDTQKKSSIQNTYNKQDSTNSFNAYKQNLNAEQQKAYNYSMNRNYNTGSKLSYNEALNTRTQRISNYDANPVRAHVNNYYFGGPISYGSAFVGIWDLWFLMRASDMFWYQHWNDINPYRSYFNVNDFAAREAAVKATQAQGIAKNSAYLDPNVDPDLQFSKGYVDKHMNSIYNTGYRKSSSHPFLILLFILIFAGILIFIIRRLLKKPVKPRNSSIY